MSRSTRKVSVSRSNEALDLKAEIERSTGRSDGTFAFSLAAGAIGLGIELLENEKAHASAMESTSHRTESAGDRDSAESVVHDTHVAVSHMHMEAQQTTVAAQVLSSTAQGQAHATGLVSPAAIALNGNEQVRQSESDTGDEAHFSGQAFGSSVLVAADHEGTSAQGAPDETHVSQVASLQPIGGASTFLPPVADHQLTDAGHPADGLLTGIGETIPDVLGPVASVLGGSDGGNLLTDAVSSVDQILMEPVGSLLGGVSELADGLAVSPILEPVTDLLAGVTDTLDETLNVSTALTPVTNLLLGTDGLVSNVLSTAADLLGGEDHSGLLSNAVSALTDVGSNDGSNVLSDLLPDVADTVGGALHDTLNVATVLTPVTDLLAGVTDTLHETLNVSTALTPVTDPLLGTDGLVPNVLSTAADLLGGEDHSGLLSNAVSALTDVGSNDGSNVLSDLLPDVADTVGGALHDTLNVATVLTPVTDTLSGSHDISAAADFAPAATSEVGSADDGSVVSDLLATATVGLHRVGAAISGAVDSVMAAPGASSGLTSGLVSKIGGQDAGSGSDIPDGTAYTSSADHGDVVSDQPVAATVVGGSDGATDATASSGQDAPALPGVGDVLDLGSGLGGAIVPVLGYIGQAHFDGVEHHDLGNSHGSLLHMLV